MNEVITFGCRLNAYESEVIKQNANSSGMQNVIIFNTCAVTSEAERQARQAIRRTKKQTPNKTIIVTGCAAQLNPESFAKMPEVSLVLGNQEKLEQSSYVIDSEKIKVNDIMSIKETASHIVNDFDGKSRAFLQIQNGCNHRCTFCAIPLARGNSRSVAIGEIVKQVKKLVDSNYNELVITGVDISDYGLDLPGKPKLGQMIKRLLALVPELPRLRISSIDVAEIDEELLELIKYEKRIMPHLHISLQSGDNMILKRMKRRHNRNQVIDFCNEVREIRKDIAFGADIIAGFPTETEEMFINSVNLIKEASLQFLHVFPYSERENTPASKMPKVPKNIRKKRAQILREIGQEQVKHFYEKMIGKTVNVIIEHNNIARSENFCEIYCPQDFKLGSIQKLKIIDFYNDKLLGIPDGTI